MPTEISKSWFCVFNNPREHGYDIEDDNELLETVAYDYIRQSTTRSCVLTLCISETGMEHIHAVFEDTVPFRFAALKKLFPAMHISATKGNKKEAEDYINKVGKYSESGETIKAKFQHGEIKGRQGQRFDLTEVQNFINQGLKPVEIFDLDIKYRRYEKLVKDAYFAKLTKEAPLLRDVNVEWHYGKTGTGKSYTYVSLCEQYGRDEIYVVSDYENGFLDNYNGQKVLFLDEFRMQIPYGKLLSMLDSYVREFHARYSNVVGLWTSVIITSPYAPEQAYRQLVKDNTRTDAQAQLMRRINSIIYHYKDGEYYKTKEYTNQTYTNAEDVENAVRGEWLIPSQEELPWNEIGA